MILEDRQKGAVMPSKGEENFKWRWWGEGGDSLQHEMLPPKNLVKEVNEKVYPLDLENRSFVNLGQKPECSIREERGEWERSIDS